MSSVITGSTAAYTQMVQYQKQKNTTEKADRKEKNERTEEHTDAGRKNEVKGAGTYGNPKLSDEGLKYYNSLKEKFGSMNFVLVSSDKKSEAEAIKGSFATPGRMTVLIDEDKIEKMATDSQYRTKIESTIANASSGISDLSKKLNSSGTKVNAFGMTVDDGGNAKFFAVLKKAGDQQKERIHKKAEQKKAEKKEAAKKAEKKAAKEKLEKTGKEEDEETVTITADSMDELIRRVQDYSEEQLIENTQTEEEKKIGQAFDYSV